MGGKPGFQAVRHRTVPRLLQLWWLYARMDLVWSLRNWHSFLMYFVSDVILNVAGITAALLMAARFHGIGGWTENQILFLLSYGLFVGGLIELFFSFNVAFISRRVGRGQLDHMLVQPQPLWMSLLTEGFLPFSGSGTSFVGAGLLAWSIHRAGVHVTSVWLLLLALSLASSTAMIVGFSYIWGSLAFWAPRGAEEINSSTMNLLNQLKPFPLDGLHGAALWGLLSIVPAGFTAWYPCRVLLGIDPRSLALAATPAAAIFSLAAAACVFHAGLRYYAKTGSQRYLDYGHRR